MGMEEEHGGKGDEYSREGGGDMLSDSEIRPIVVSNLLLLSHFHTSLGL